jgi:hypothetical protein
MLLNNHIYLKRIWILPLVVVLVLAAENGHPAKKKDKDKKNKQVFAMTEAELQSQVMSFADRYASIMATASGSYDNQSPPPQQRRIVRSNVVYSLAAAFTIAAESDPDAALLDMMVMVTLGRMIFEEHWLKKFGGQVKPIVTGFQQAEEDIWQIAEQVLTPEQQKELYTIIKEWRQENPKLYFFSYIRFSDFAADRRRSKLAKTQKTKGLFKSVESATQQVEEVRLLAERGMFLGTRLPLLTGAFADLWISQLTANPDVNKILADLHQFSEVSGRLADVAEKLPGQIAKERNLTIQQATESISDLTTKTLDEVADRVASERRETIKQFIYELSEERRNTIQDFLSQEQNIRGLMTDLKQTIVAGNELLTSANTLTERLNLRATDASDGGSSKPFDIKDYRATLTEATTVIQQLDGLVKTVEQLMISPGWKNSLPRIIEAIEQVEAKGGRWVTYSFLLGMALILIFLVGAVFAMLAYRYFSQRIGGIKNHEVNAS